MVDPNQVAVLVEQIDSCVLAMRVELKQPTPSELYLSAHADGLLALALRLQTAVNRES